MLIIYVFISVSLVIETISKESVDGFCSSSDKCASKYITPRFVLYDVNEPEGFNLKRDVYMRMATFVKEFSREGDCHLVLPPWSNLYHWRSSELEVGLQTKIPWKHFFNIHSLQLFAPVMEFEDFIQETKFGKIDYLFVLQHLSADINSVSEWKEGWSVGTCQRKSVINYKKLNDVYVVDILGYNNITFKHIDCISFHGHSNLLGEIVTKYNTKSVLFQHAEIALHNNFGDALYWQCRRSMRFAPYLINIAAEFRQRYLNSNDSMDKIELPNDWRLEKPGRKAVGGPYLAVHLRRRDFLWGRPNDTPSLEKAAEQIILKLNELHLNTVFVSTDAPQDEFEVFTTYLFEYNIVRYIPDSSTKKILKDGGIAVVDQIICSSAKYFIGSFESTFSFRIQEEREIRGFKKKTTFNRFCGDNQQKCTQPTSWTIVY